MENPESGPLQPTAERWYRSATVRTVGTILIAILTAILVYLNVRSSFSGVKISTTEATTAALAVVAGILGALGYLVASRAGARDAQEEARRKAESVPAELVGKWRDLLARTREIYGQQSSHMTSFAFVSRQLVNYILPQTRPNITPAERSAAEQANAALNGMNSFVSTHIILAWSDTLLAKYAENDRSLFWAAKEAIESVITGGAMFADNWIGIVRQAGAASLGQHLRDEWNRFREAANRLGENLTRLDRRTFQTLGTGTSNFALPIREL